MMQSPKLIFKTSDAILKGIINELVGGNSLALSEDNVKLDMCCLYPPSSCIKSQAIYQVGQKL